jgi:twitching motility protein PilT
MSDKLELEKLLEFAVQKKASDVHFRVGQPPVFRLRGDLKSIKMTPLTDPDMVELCKLLTSSSGIAVDLRQVRELDGSFELGTLGRFRFNIFRHEGSLGAVLRVIPASVPMLEDLMFPPVIKKIAAIERGFVLVTGSTGQGKSTTLAAMIDYLNTTRNSHIITIEDPIEFIHRPKKSKITQREVGRDTESFATALRSALRQDPNTIMVGEMRDPESIDIALKAAETGHTVFSTVHTTDAAKSVARMISMFPPEEQSLVRLRLADCLKATISQRLLKRADGNGRVVAQEIMVSNTAIAECIADPQRTAEIPTFIENAQSLLGSQTFHWHLSKLYREGVISLDVAKQASNNAADFEHFLNYEKNETDPLSGERSKETKSVSKIDSSRVVLDIQPHVTSSGTREETDPGTSDEEDGLLNQFLHSIKKAK